MHNPGLRSVHPEISRLLLSPVQYVLKFSHVSSITLDAVLFFFQTGEKNYNIILPKKRKIRYGVSLNVRKWERVDLSDSRSDGIAVSDSPVGIQFGCLLGSTATNMFCRRICLG